MKKKLGLLMFALTVVLSACGGGNEPKGTDAGTPSASPSSAPPAEASVDELPPVELIHYIPDYNTNAAMPEVNEAVNEYLKEKINATVKMIRVDWGSYTQKMNVILASNDPVDLFTTFSVTDLTPIGLVNKGALLDSTELFEKYAPQSLSYFTPTLLDTAKINGRLYAMPNYLMWAQEAGFTHNIELATRNNIDFSNVKKFEDMEPILRTIKANEPGVIPLVLSDLGFLNPLGGASDPSLNIWDINKFTGVKMDDSSMTVVSAFETPEFLERAKVVRKWYQDGLINSDAVTTKDVNALKPKAFTDYGAVHADMGLELMDSIWKPWGTAVKAIAVTPTFSPYNAAQTSMTAIAANSKNPERAAMYLELLHSDPEFSNLFLYGVEGKHYNKVDGKYREAIDGVDYNLPDWVVCNCQLKLLAPGQAADTLEQEKMANDKAITADFAGFSFNPEPVKTEIANATAALNEFLPGITTGSLDPEKYIPQLVAKLKSAGLEKIITETQTQLDTWAKAVGKK